MIAPRYLLTGNDLALPIENPAKLHDIRVTKLDQLLGRLFAASAATAIYHNELILIGQFGDLGSTNGFIGHIDGIRDMPCGKLVGATYVEDDLAALLCHHSHRVIHGDAAVGVVCLIANACASGEHQRG